MDIIDLIKNDIINKYDCLTVDEAPTNTGLYAWYGTNEITSKDYSVDISDGIDVGIERTAKRLADLSKRYVMPKINIFGEGAFSTRWNGDFNDETIDNVIKYVENYNQDNEDCKLINQIITTPTEREKLSNILKAVVPFTSAPIYIGVADNLKTRLTKHADGVKTLSELLTSNKCTRDDYIKNARSRKNNFAIRAVAMGFKVEGLIVYTFNIDKYLGCTNNRKVAELAEWFLNKWNKPILGEK